jgi:hypothetical protein
MELAAAWSVDLLFSGSGATCGSRVWQLHPTSNRCHLKLQHGHSFPTPTYMEIREHKIGRGELECALFLISDSV